MHVRLDLDAVRENAAAVRRMVDGDVVGVVKGVDARREVVEAFLAAGIDAIAVSRVEHLSRLRDLDATLVMLRIPALSELPAVVSLADVTLHGSLRVVEAAAEEALRQGTIHRVVPMVDAGDGREGVPVEDAESFLEAIGRLDGVEFDEVGVNLGCFGDDPDPEAVHRIADHLPDYPLSVGGTGMLPIREELPDSVTAYRIGDAVLTGRFRETPIDGLRGDAIELRAEVLADGPNGAVIDVGNVTTDPRHLVPDGAFSILRSSNELSVIDADVEAGDDVSFEMEYDAIATTFDSRYGRSDATR